ncbi:MAG: class IV adenylate cyclase [Myxococcota bacterium]|nr:class IV adenylate cyclase [Myxococcota bacterium]
MARTNLEIKARCDDLDAVRERARTVATRWVGVDRQVDTYFRTARGRLKLRESSLSGGQLVPYLRPDRPGPRRSDYLVVPVEDPVALRELLSALLGVHRVVRKEREIALAGNVRIHLDRVDGLGSFVELEAVYDGGEEAEAGEREKVARLMEALGLREADRVPGSYETLLGEGAEGAQRGK